MKSNKVCRNILIEKRLIQLRNHAARHKFKEWDRVVRTSFFFSLKSVSEKGKWETLNIALAQEGRYHGISNLISINYSDHPQVVGVRT